MRFKVDQNLPVEIAMALRDAGHDAHTVYDEELAGTPDPELGVIIRGERRGLVTLDLGLVTSATIRRATTKGSSCCGHRAKTRRPSCTYSCRPLRCWITKPLSVDCGLSMIGRSECAGDSPWGTCATLRHDSLLRCADTSRKLTAGRATLLLLPPVNRRRHALEPFSAPEM